MNPAADLAILTQQLSLLHFPAFSADTAWQLGNLLRSKVIALGSASGATPAGCTMEIDLAGHVLFTSATPGATPGQADWIRRKRNVVRRFATSSYAVGRKLELNGQTLEARHGLFLADYATDGGGFPILLANSGMVGTIVLSGLAQRDDHNLVAASLSEFLHIPIPVLT